MVRDNEGSVKPRNHLESGSVKPRNPVAMDFGRQAQVPSKGPRYHVRTLTPIIRVPSSGGGDDTARKAGNGELKQLLTDAGEWFSEKGPCFC